MKTTLARRLVALGLLLLLSALVACVALGGAGCAKRETAVQAGIRTQTLHIGNHDEPADLDPHVAAAVGEGNILLALFEGLTAEGESGEAVPATAERWDISPDGLTYTFHLRPNLRWSNGDPVVAGDFVSSFQRMLSPKLAAEYSYMLCPIESSTTEENNFRAGQLHVTWDLPMAKVPAYRAKSPTPMALCRSIGTNLLRFNVAHAPLGDPRVRRALGLAIDREAMARVVTHGTRPAALALTPPRCGGYTPRARVGYDPPAAQRLLAEAGYPNGKGWPPISLQTFNGEVNQGRLEALLLEEAPITPLDHLTRAYLVHPSVKGWAPSVLGYYRYKSVSLESPRTVASP